MRCALETRLRQRPRPTRMVRSAPLGTELPRETDSSIPMASRKVDWHSPGRGPPSLRRRLLNLGESLLSRAGGQTILGASRRSLLPGVRLMSVGKSGDPSRNGGKLLAKKTMAEERAHLRLWRTRHPGLRRQPPTGDHLIEDGRQTVVKRMQVTQGLQRVRLGTVEERTHRQHRQLEEARHLCISVSTMTKTNAAGDWKKLG